MGSLELQRINEVIGAIDGESLNDFVEKLRLVRRKAEFDHTLKFRDAIAAVEKRLREQDIPTQLVAKAARNLGDS
jgi:hypothetical protein